MRKEGDKNQNFGKKRDCRSVLTSVQSQRKKKGVGGGGGEGWGVGGSVRTSVQSQVYTHTPWESSASGHPAYAQTAAWS